MNKIINNRYSGWFKCSILKINPNKNELEEILNENIEEEPEYIGKTLKGNRYIKINIYIQDIKTESLFCYPIYLEDREEKFNNNVIRYINQSGQYQISNNENNLFSNFTNFTEQIWENKKLLSEIIKEKKEYRIAKIGEYDLSHFYIMSLSSFNKKGNYLLDMDSIFDNNLSNLNIRLNEPVFCAYAYCDNNENYNQRIFKKFMNLNDYSSLITNSSNMYNSGLIKKWKKEWSFIKEDKIYKEGRLMLLSDEDIPKTKEINQENSDY